MPRNQDKSFGSEWRSDERYDRSERDRDFNRDFNGSNRFPEDYEQREFSGRNENSNRTGRDYNRDYGRDRDMNRRFMTRDDHHRGNFGDRDYNRDYNLGTGTAMRMNRYESSESGQQDRGFFGKGPKGWKRSDERIKDEVCEALNDSYSVDASEIEVNVKEGHVILTGTIEGRDAKREVEHLVDGIRGVEDVQNNLKLNRKENVTEMRRSGTDSGKSASLS
jgi:hypothetical protein